jgi:hypothetical protein
VPTIGDLTLSPAATGGRGGVRGRSRGGGHRLIDGGGRGGGQLAGDADLQAAGLDLDFGQAGVFQDVGQLAHHLGVDGLSGVAGLGSGLGRGHEASTLGFSGQAEAREAPIRPEAASTASS